MSETTSQGAEPTETVETPDADRDWKAEAEKQRSFAREQEKRAKENAAKAKEYDAYVESQKTEQQKLSDRLATIERERDAAVNDALKFRIAARYGLDEDEEFDLLGAGSEEQLESRAKYLQRLKGGTSAASGASSRPKERLRPGATPASESRVSASEAGRAEAARRFGKHD